MTTVKAKSKWVRIGPRKLQKVAALLRGRPAAQALDMLNLMPQKGARILAKVLKSAIANARNNFKLAADSLVVDEAYANKGIVMKRFRACARGKVGQVQKPNCHITISLRSLEPNDAKEAKS